MGLFNGVDYVLLIQSHQLGIYSLSSSEVYKIDFPESIVNYQEIKNNEKFKELLNEFINKEKLFGKNAIIVLSEDIVFEKIVANEEISKNPNLAITIFEEMPLSYEELGKKIIASKNETKIWGTNKIIFEEIKKIVENNSWKVLSVVPINAFPNLRKQVDFSGSIFQEIIKDQNYLRSVDFLIESKNLQESKKNNSLLIILVLVILMIGCLSFFYFKVNTTSTLKTAITPTAPTSTTPTTIKKIINKADYKITILNGSGKTGEASALKNILEKSGFLVDKTDNADNSDYQKTLILTTNNVPADYINELKIILSKIYEVDEKISSGGAGVDVEIIIGKISI